MGCLGGEAGTGGFVVLLGVTWCVSVWVSFGFFLEIASVSICDSSSFLMSVSFLFSLEAFLFTDFDGLIYLAESIVKDPFSQAFWEKSNRDTSKYSSFQSGAPSTNSKYVSAGNTVFLC